MKMDAYIGDKEVVVEFDYTAPQKPNYNVDSPLVGPGNEAEVDLVDVFYKGRSIYKKLKLEEEKNLEIYVLENIDDCFRDD